MAWWDYFIEESNHINSVVSSLFGITAIGDALASFIEPFIGALIQVLMLLVYPFVILLDIVQQALLTIFQSAIDVMNGTIYLINDIGYMRVRLGAPPKAAPHALYLTPILQKVNIWK